jgi:3alpha(or 20beta)-hydroxysteroid dehydrogenase
MGRLDGKVAIVTGAARGTGAATARLFVAEGAKVVLGDIRHEQGEAVAKELGSAALYVHLDITSEKDWADALARTAETFGPVNVLVNNAAVLHVEALADTTLDDFVRVVTVNQVGTFLGIRSVVEPMRVAGGGAIVNVASVDGIEGMNGTSAYACSKWGMRGLAKVAALELGQHGIRVNTVCPHGGSNEMKQPFVDAAMQRIQEARERGDPIPDLSGTAPFMPLRRRVTMEEIASVILFLASDESSGCSGGDFAVDGGYTAGKIIAGAPGAPPAQ